jgi:hypothetical protein
MGAATSKLQDGDAADVGAAVASLGVAFEQYRQLIVENGVDGKTLLSLQDTDLDESIPNTLPRRRLLTELSKLKAAHQELYSAHGSSKFVVDKQFFKFGSSDVFRDGLRGFLAESDLKRSMEQECSTNEGGKYKETFDYVVSEKAVEKQVLDQNTGIQRMKDFGHNNWTLANFCSLEVAVKANLTPAHVAAIRLYTGALYAPWNWALRNATHDAKAELLNW